MNSSIVWYGIEYSIVVYKKSLVKKISFFMKLSCFILLVSLWRKFKQTNCCFIDTKLNTR